MLSLGRELRICSSEHPSELTKLLTWCQTCPCLMSRIPSKWGNSFPGMLGTTGTLLLSQTEMYGVASLVPSFLGRIWWQANILPFFIVTKTHCSSHCAKTNQLRRHSWVSDSRGQRVSLGRNWFCFHRLTDTDNISWGHTDSVLVFFFWCLWTGL